MSTDAELMARALELAANALYDTDPNPAVGCVVVADGEIVAEGNHEELLQSSPLYQEIYESQLGSGITAGLEVEVAK